MSLQPSKSAINTIETNGIDIGGMTPTEIKQRLKELGVTTRLRNIHKLRESFEDALSGISN